MTDRLSSRRFRPILLAVLGAALGVFSARAENTFSLDVVAGVNYEAVEIAPVLTGEWGDVTLSLAVRDVTGAEATVTNISFTTDPLVFTNLTPGATCLIDGYVVDEEGATNAYEHLAMVLGRPHDDNWLDEDAETYDGGRPGSQGVWTGTEYAHTEGGQIAVDTDPEANPDATVGCTVGTVPTPRRGYVITTTATFPEATWSAPSAAGRKLGLSMAYPSAGEISDPVFIIVDDGAWREISRSVCDPAVSQTWQIRISVDIDAARASYYVRANGTGSWTLLGSAEDQEDLGDVTRAVLYGKGTVASLKGNGFDTQLVQFDVEYDDRTLFPGCNFEETVVTGRVHVTEVHKTDRSTGSFAVQLSDLEGHTVTTTNYTYTVGDWIEFYVKASELTAGSAYRAEIVVSSEAEVNTVDTQRIAVMGKAITNELWGTDGRWIHETARTFALVDPGTGGWSGRAYASTNGEWIAIKTLSSTEDIPSGAVVEFFPTNEVEDVASYVTSVRAIFHEAAGEPDPETAAFGVTLVSLDGVDHFMCLSNHVWCTIPLETLTPQLDVEYTFTIFVEKDQQLASYYATLPGGDMIRLAGFTLDADIQREFTSVEFSGVGDIADLTGDAYSTELLKLEVNFDDDALYPGTNFEATAANGWVRFTPLWETDRTNGNIRVVIRNKWGDVVGIRRISFHNLDERDFGFYVEGLTPGETYTVDVAAEVKGTDVSGSSVKTGTMARTLTNELWATEGWIREDVDTFAKRKTGSGTWDTGTGFATEEDGYISVNTTSSEDEYAHVTFTATNQLPEYTAFELRTKLVFDTACVDLPTIDGEYGMTLIYAPEALDEGTESYLFAILSNGVWTAISSEIYEAQLGVEYELTVKVDKREGTAYYAIREDIAEQPEVIAVFDVEDYYTDATYEAAYYGIGRVATHEGDGLDVSLVKISVDFDQTLLTPGTNFAATVAGGTLHIKPIWPTDRTDGDFTIYVRDAFGRLVSATTLSYHELVDHDFLVPVEGLEAGGAYDIEVVATLDGDEVGRDFVLAKMGRTTGTWIDEDAETFLGERTGTGLWLNTNGTASVVGTGDARAIAVDVDSWTDHVLFAPTNDSLEVRSSTLREIRLNLCMDDVGWFETEDPPEVPLNALAGATLWCDDTESEDDDGEMAIAVVSNGVWTVVDSTKRRCDRETEVAVNVLIDYKNGFVRYDLALPTYSNRVCQYDIEPNLCASNLVDFSGTGRIRSIDGDVWDPNLFQSGTNEYATLDDAIRGADGTIYPLWWADQLVTVAKGSFRLYDDYYHVAVRFPWWYYVVIDEQGDLTVYTFNSSNNWIDYARNTSDDIEIDGSVFLVKTPEGLSWIAAQATNEWISGRIELAADIDLSLHNWTPIAGFTGAFDGKGRTITGLNNLFRNAGIPGGEYVSGPTNDWGRSTYGLFGTATNSTFTGVTFAGVAISNVADSVAALVGALAGDSAISNVTVTSGSIRGDGGTVAGLAGYADFANALTVINSTNRADVTDANNGSGEGRWAAGLLCVAGPTDPAAPLGTLVVTNNANAGTISGVLYDLDLYGGNIAQILAGTTVGARFGEVHLTNNVATGKVEANLVRSDENTIEVTAYPEVNLGPAFWGYDWWGVTDEEKTFMTFLEGNDPAAVAVDPVRRTARMLGRMFVNGTLNDIGILNDRISESLPGETVTMTEGVESWGPIVLDRDLTFDLNGKSIYTVWVNNTFVISNGVVATVRNGTIAVGPECQPFVGDTSHLTQENLTIDHVEQDFWERTKLFDLVGVSADGDEFLEPASAYLLDMSMVSLVNYSGTVIQLYEDGDVDIDVDAGTLSVNGHVVAQLADCYRFVKTVVKTDDGSGETVEAVRFEVVLADSARPTAEFSMSGVGENANVSVTVGNATEGLYYALQHKESLLEEWTEPAADEWKQATSSGVTLEADATGSSGYYRVIMTDHIPAGTSD